MREIKLLVDQISPDVATEGDSDYPAMSTMRQLFTADWQQRLILAGFAYTLDLGTVAATAYTALTGNAAPDLDQPEIVIAADSGWLIPMEIDIGFVNDFAAYNDAVDICFVADRTYASAAGQTATVEVPNNLLDGGDIFGGRCFSIVTGDISSPAAPSPADLLAYDNWTLIQVAAETSGNAPAGYHYVKKFQMPTILAGPCQIVGYITGTNTPNFLGNVKFAHIPSANIKV